MHIQQTDASTTCSTGKQAPVRQIEPRNGQDPKEERFWRDNRHRPECGDRYTDRRRDDYDHDERREDGYNKYVEVLLADA